MGEALSPVPPHPARAGQPWVGTSPASRWGPISPNFVLLFPLVLGPSSGRMRTLCLRLPHLGMAPRLPRSVFLARPPACFPESRFVPRVNSVPVPLEGARVKGPDELPSFSAPEGGLLPSRFHPTGCGRRPVSLGRPGHPPRHPEVNKCLSGSERIGRRSGAAVIPYPPKLPTQGREGDSHVPGAGGPARSPDIPRGGMRGASIPVHTVLTPCTERPVGFRIQHCTRMDDPKLTRAELPRVQAH